MKYCSQCGQQLPDEARFCGACGVATPELKEASATAMEPETLFAVPAAMDSKETGPGTGLDTPLQPSTPPNTGKQQGKGPHRGIKRTALIGSIMAFVLVAGGFWGWWSHGTEARVQAKLDLAVKYLSENKFKEAILAYNDAIKIDPKEVKAYQGLAKTYTLQGKYDEAKATYERGVAAVSPEDKLLLRLGLAGMYIDKGDLQEAERYFQGIIDENKTCVAAYQGLAMVYQQQGDKDKARAILEQGVKENAGDYRAYNALARFNANSGEQDKALANIVKSFEDIPAT
ncbi:MAG: tetratricopeptide repeat protein [Bacillota bacterium]|nr:tetratricopeptide repeat protein [Bacillota bacterium]